ncbi:MAG: hypothetical protein M1817_003686 [Caeruleum heppii]|nr:MAG: hypothetical protein M1817_003686 [Caeruleum heppii]
MANIFRQIWTLITKTLILTVIRRPISTAIRAFIYPLALILVLSYAQFFLNPPQTFGVASPSPILSLEDALPRASPSRDTVAFVHNGLTGGAISAVIEAVAGPCRSAGKTVRLLASNDELISACESSARASSNCYGAVTFHSSISEPADGGLWNYTITTDGSLGRNFDVTSTSNDAQVYLMPLQLAIDQAIVANTPDANRDSLRAVDQLLFTPEEEKKRARDTQMSYLDGLMTMFGVVFFFAYIPVVYHSAGIMASEREIGLSQLIEAMMPNTTRWTPQLIRLLSHHLSFDIIYGVGWLAMGIVLTTVVFVRTSPAIIIFVHLLVGLSLSSFALFGAAFFKKAQLSGITVTIVITVLAVIPQVLPDLDQTPLTVRALSVIFPSSNYYYFLSLLAKWEFEGLPANLMTLPPGSEREMTGIAFLGSLIGQVIVYPILAVIVERLLHGTASKGRRVSSKGDDSGITVRLRDFRKTYRPNWLLRLFTSRKDVNAVKGLTLDARRGQIFMLLGPNGSGKSTTLDAVAGLSKVTSGSIDVDGTGGLGIAPQKNVMWADLTVEEHVRIFYNLKRARGSKDEVKYLVKACDLSRKTHAKSKTLSGGQKRKLQLALMFAGGSAVCCVDEVSSGLDPLSRRKIWDILLAERGDRTIIMTTHFLDEADYLSDEIAILSKGDLKAQGSSVELKNRMGDGYSIHVPTTNDRSPPPLIDGVNRMQSLGLTTYNVSDSSQAVQLLHFLEQRGVHDYRVAGPTLEDLFLKLADVRSSPDGILDAPDPLHSSQASSVHSERQRGAETLPSTPNSKAGVDLVTGKHIGPLQQMRVLYRKRLTIFKRNYLPFLAAITLALIGAGVSPLLLKFYSGISCELQDISSYTYGPVSLNLGTAYDLRQVLIGPESRLDRQSLADFASLYFKDSRFGDISDLTLALATRLRTVEGYDEFLQYIAREFAEVAPGGYFLGDGSSPPTVAWAADIGLLNPLIMLNLLDSTLSNTDIIASYSVFDLPPRADLIGFAPLLFVSYFALIMACYPAFFALYPTLERLRKVRALQYSNGVRPLPLWLAHISFDAFFVLLISSVSAALLTTSGSAWYQLPLLWIVLFLYGISSTLLSYIISTFARTTLAAWAICAGVQAFMFAAYFGAHLGVAVNVSTAALASTMNAIHFTLGLISPMANLARALFIGLGLFGLTCGGNPPASIVMYGGPILYLVLQSFAFFGILLWFDSGFSVLSLFKRKTPVIDTEKSADIVSPEMAEELERVSSATSGLRISHLSKSFGKHKAVDDVTFGVRPGEVFALLGPNGAGKSTTISLVRGDIRPSDSRGQIMVDEASVITDRATARAHLGVCPQFDACDRLTVEEQLKFYARVRGVSHPEHNVNEVIRAFGLETYRNRLAQKLSGGTQRKLSLAIALIGNPSVLLLDEPSSGLDAASKRVMWDTLSGIAKSRSVVLTTHSMEEADALADRAGIMASRLLALGTCDALRRRWGDVYHVHLVTRSAPHTDAREISKLKSWLRQHLPGAVVENQTYCGQVRLTVPARSRVLDDAVPTESGPMGVGQLMALLERNKQTLGLAFYSIGQTTLDEVFVDIVRKHGGEEENSGVVPRRGQKWARFKGLFYGRKAVWGVYDGHNHGLKGFA